MAWHARPGGASQFPNGTDAQWAAAWFAPINATHLNYLNDNLTFLRNPTGVVDFKDTIDTVRTSPVSTSLDIATGNFTYSGGRLYVGLSIELLYSATAYNYVFVKLQGPSGPLYEILANMTVAVSSGSPITDLQNTAAGTYVQEVLIGIVDATVIPVGSVSYKLQIFPSGGAVTVSCKNARLLIREL